MAHRKTSKRSKAKTILRLADLEQSKNAVLHSLGAPVRKNHTVMARNIFRVARLLPEFDHFLIAFRCELVSYVATGRSTRKYTTWPWLPGVQGGAP
jgi:hypothetical protein